MTENKTLTGEVVKAASQAQKAVDFLLEEAKPDATP